MGGGYIWSGIWPDVPPLWKSGHRDTTRSELLAREDTDVAEEVANIMREDGLEVLLETKPVSVEQSSHGTISLTVQTKTGERTLTGSHLLMAAGRVPNTDWLNLEAAGIQTDKHGFIQVNERLETNRPGIYA